MLRNFTLRIDDELLAKFHYVSRYSGRSANSQLLMMVRKIVEQFEQAKGLSRSMSRRTSSEPRFSYCGNRVDACFPGGSGLWMASHSHWRDRPAVFVGIQTAAVVDAFRSGSRFLLRPGSDLRTVRDA